ncbi:hypothetical protein KIPB_006010, partial [Kipferlia bialata]
LQLVLETIKTQSESREEELIATLETEREAASTRLAEARAETERVREEAEAEREAQAEREREAREERERERDAEEAERERVAAEERERVEAEAEAARQKQRQEEMAAVEAERERERAEWQAEREREAAAHETREAEREKAEQERIAAWEAERESATKNATREAQDSSLKMGIKDADLAEALQSLEVVISQRNTALLETEAAVQAQKNCQLEWEAKEQEWMAQQKEKDEARAKAQKEKDDRWLEKRAGEIARSSEEVEGLKATLRNLIEQGKKREAEREAERKSEEKKARLRAKERKAEAEAQRIRDEEKAVLKKREEEQNALKAMLDRRALPERVPGDTKYRGMGSEDLEAYIANPNTDIKDRFSAAGVLIVRYRHTLTAKEATQSEELSNMALRRKLEVAETTEVKLRQQMNAAVAECNRLKAGSERGQQEAEVEMKALAEAVASLKEKHAREITGLRQQNRSLQANLRHATSDLAGTASERRKAEARIQSASGTRQQKERVKDQLVGETAALRQQLVEAKRREDNTRIQMAHAQTQLQDAEKRLTLNASETSTLKAALAEGRAKAQSMHVSLRECRQRLADLERRGDKLVSDNSDLKAACKKAREDSAHAKAQAMRLTKQTEARQAHTDRMASALKTARAELGNVKDTLGQRERDIVSLGKRNASLTAEIRQLKDRVRVVENHAAAKASDPNANAELRNRLQYKAKISINKAKAIERERYDRLEAQANRITKDYEELLVKYKECRESLRQSRLHSRAQQRSRNSGGGGLAPSASTQRMDGLKSPRPSAIAARLGLEELNEMIASRLSAPNSPTGKAVPSAVQSGRVTTPSKEATATVAAGASPVTPTLSPPTPEEAAIERVLEEAVAAVTEGKAEETPKTE